METTEWAVPCAAQHLLRNLSGVECEDTWTMVQADLRKSLQSGAYVNIDGDEVRRIFDSGRTMWNGTYFISPGRMSNSIAEIGKTILARKSSSIISMVAVVSGRADLLGLSVVKALHTSINEAMAPQRWTYGVVHESVSDNQLRLSLLVMFASA